MTDMGTGLLDWYQQSCGMEQEWLVREGRSLTWWPHQFRQTVVAQPPRLSHEEQVTRLVSTTPLAVNVPDDAPLELLIRAGNMEASFSALVFDPVTRSFRIGLAASFHQGNAAWLRSLFAVGSVLQVALPHGMPPESMTGSGMGQPDLAPHPRSGLRASPDEMLTLPGATQQAGARPPLVTEQVCKEAARMLKGLGIPAKADGDALTVVTPLQNTKEMATTLLMQNRHPGFGNGLFILDTPNLEVAEDKVTMLANRLNLRELTEPVDQHAFGAWVAGPKDQLQHVAFITSDVLAGFGQASLPAMLVNLALNEVGRLYWLDASWDVKLA